MITSTSTSLEEKYAEILSHTNWEAVLTNLGLEPKSKGDYIEIECPSCKERRAFFYPNLDTGKPKIICNRKNECGFENHILEHLNGGVFPSGESWKEAVKKLADLAGVPFDLTNELHLYRATKKRPILDAYWKLLRERFPGSPAEKYIVETRKLNPSLTQFGYFPQHLEELKVWSYKEGFSDEELLSAGIIKEKDGRQFVAMYGRLAGAFIDQRGIIHNIWGRDLTGKVEGSRKYLNLDNSDFAHKKSPYGAECFKGGVVAWVEGYLDAVALKECGITAVASGTASIPEEMVKSLQGINTIVIALDRDGAGGKGAFRFIEKNANNESLKIFSINHDLMKGCKDLAELYHKEGAQAVKELFLQDNLEHSFKFAADYIIDESKGEAEWSAASKENAIHQAENFYKKVVASSRIPFLDEFFWEKGIQPALNLNSEALNSHRESLSKKRQKDEFKQKIEQLSQEALEKTKSGDIEAATQTLAKANSLCASQSKEFKRASVQFVSSLGESWLTEKPPQKEMLLHYYHAQDPKGFLPRGIVGMVAGPGGVGKSHLMTQMGVSVCSGSPLFGKFHIKKTGNVFLGMGENSMDDLRRFVWKSTQHLSQQEKNSVIKHLAPFSFHGQNAAFIEDGKPSAYYWWLKDELTRNAPEDGWSLLVFDPASRLLGVDAEKDNALATLFISLLEALTEDLPGYPTVLFAHHVNKGAINQKEQQNQSAARGASGLTDGSRWQLNFFKNEGENNNTYGLKLVKTNFTGPIETINLDKDNNGVLQCVKGSW